MDKNTIGLDIYGFKINVCCGEEEVLGWIEKDFSYFGKEACTCDLKIEIFPEGKSLGDLPEMVAAFSTPRNVCYYKDGITYIDYFGRAMAMYDRGKGLVRISSNDPYLLHEVAYQSILSLAGQYLDKKAFHRIHGIGIDVDGKAAIVMLDSGSGKTELALRFLRSGGSYKLISEDTPLVNRRSEVLPFPLRIGVRSADSIPDIPEEKKVRFPTVEFGEKQLIDIAYFGDKMPQGPSSAWLLIMGKRSTFEEPRIYPVSKSAIFGNIFRNYIMGIGVYQGLEFMLRSSPVDIFTKAGTVLSRFVNSLVLVFRSKTFCFILSKDTAANYEFLMGFIEKQKNRDKDAGYGRSCT